MADRGHQVECKSCGIIAVYPATQVGLDYAIAAIVKHEDRDLWGMPRRPEHACTTRPKPRTPEVQGPINGLHWRGDEAAARFDIDPGDERPSQVG